MAFGALLAVGLSAFVFFAQWISALDERRLEEAKEGGNRRLTLSVEVLERACSTIVEPTVFC